jgi:type IV secretion system protein VirD4
LLDEMPKMQKMQAVIQGPDVGRGQQISYLFIGQDLHQIAEKYGQDASKTVISTTAAKVILRQNDLETARQFSEMIGTKITMKKEKGADGKEVEVPKEEPLFSPYDIMKLKFGEGLILYEGWYHRPIKAEIKMSFNDPRLSGYVKMGRSSPLPEFLIPMHHAILEYSGNPRYYNPQTNELIELAPVVK